MNRTDLETVMTEIQRCERVPDHRRPHTLLGEYSDCWECHLADDWLIIWRFSDEDTVEYVRTGTHDELFR